MEEGGYPGYSYVLFRGDKRRTLLEEDMYVDKISMIFQVIPSTVHITDDNNRTIFADRATGSFPVYKLVHRGHYEVHGEPVQTQSQLPASTRAAGVSGVPFAFQRRPSSAAAAAPTEAATGTPRARASQPNYQPPRSFLRTIIVAQVVNGNLFGKRTLEIRLTEADATLEGVKAKVMAELGSDEPVSLLDTKGHEIMDSEVARSPDYWESKNRTFYSLTATEFEDFQNGRMAKLRRTSEVTSPQDISAKIVQVKEAAEGLQVVTSALNQLSDLAKIKRTAASLQGPMNEAFACQICHGTMEVPIIATCCFFVVGCQACVRQSTSTSCPKCNVEGFQANVHQLKGLDQVLSALRNTQTE